jgi:hypothetical protein
VNPSKAGFTSSAKTHPESDVITVNGNPRTSPRELFR